MGRAARKFDFKSAGSWTRTSDLFDKIGSALAAYDLFSNQQNLRFLIQAVADWRLSKTTAARPDGLTGTKREAAVTQLCAWLVVEMQSVGLLATTLDKPWSSSHNCYCYAMHCDQPRGRGNNAWPGSFEKGRHPIEEFVLGENMDVKGARWANGVIRDGARQQKIITTKGQIRGRPATIPIVDGVGYYLVAMISSNDGYHFMRRDERSQLVSQKRKLSHTRLAS